MYDANKIDVHNLCEFPVGVPLSLEYPLAVGIDWLTWCCGAGLQSAPSFGHGLRSAFMQSASTALPEMPEASSALFDIPKGFSKGFSLAPSMDQLMPNMDPLGMSLNDFLLGEAS